MSTPALRGRFLMAMIDAGGTVPPALAVAAQLVERGHQVRVLADPTVEAGARAAGCEFSPWREAPHFHSREEQSAVIAAFESHNPYRALKTVRKFTGREMTRRQARDLVSNARDFPTDAILVDILPGMVVGALATGLPTAALMANIYAPPTAGYPLLGTGWSPGHSLLLKARDRLAPAAAQWLLARGIPRLNAVLSSYDRAPLATFSDLFDRCSRVLVMTSPSFDFPVPRLPDNVRYVGPCLTDPDWAARVPWQRTGYEPVVLVGTSSVYQHQQVDLLRRVATALGQLPVHGVLTTGRAVAPEEVPAPPNVEVLRAAPHQRVLQEASVVITHAGHGTVLKTLGAGVPLVCMPMGRDQKDNTVRVLRLGAGVRLDKRAAPEEIAGAVSHVLGNPRYAQAARRFAETLAEETTHGPTAVAEIEALPDSAQPSRG